jgi:DNA-binding XRE family transcriptional regulator
MGADHVHNDDAPKRYPRGRRCYVCGAKVNMYQPPVWGLPNVVLCCRHDAEHGESGIAFLRYLANKGIAPPREAGERYGRSRPLPNLHRVRVREGYSRQRLADRSGVSRHTIANIETDGRFAGEHTSRKLAKALGVKREVLLGG